MAYITIDDILQRIPEESVLQLTDDNNAGVVDLGHVAAAISRAEQEIDAWCGALYLVPFPVIPAVVVGLAADLAIYFLYGRTVDEIPEARKDAYKNALKLLDRIARDQVTLGVAQRTVSTPASAEVVGGNKRLFSRDSLRGM